MRKTILAAALALGLAGCGTSVFQGGTSLLTTIENPVGRNELASIEGAYGVAYTAAVAYRGLCARREIPRSCRAVVVKLQGASRKAQGALVAARRFVRDNPTISAISAIGAARAALTDFQAVAAANGVR